MAERIGSGGPSVPSQVNAQESVETTKQPETKASESSSPQTGAPPKNPKDLEKLKTGRFSEFALAGISQAAVLGMKTLGKALGTLPTDETLKRNDLQKDPRADVTNLQKQVNHWRTEHGKKPIKEDGLFGKNTEQAVTDFQSANHLSNDGKAGVATQNRLLLENNDNFKKLDDKSKNETRKLMTGYGHDSGKMENLRQFATDPNGLAKLAGKAEFGNSSEAVKKSVIDTLAQNQPMTQAKLDSTTGLLGSAGFTKLSDAGKALVTDGLKGAKADPKYAENMTKLLNDPKFQALKPNERTAVLSQLKNYPDARSVANVDRMLQKDWFTSQSLHDKQRSLKMVSYLSQYDAGDRKIVDNTLNKFLDPASDYKLEWKTYHDKPSGGTTFGEGGDKTLWLNRGILKADDKKMVENEDTLHLVLSTVPHEVNHLLNNDKVESNYKYFEAEYRAWYVGFEAQNGRAPTNQEAMDQRISWQLDPDSFYGKYAKEALKDPAEAAKFYDLLTKMSGQTVDASNWDTVIKSDPSTWSGKDSPAPVPSGNIDNH